MKTKNSLSALILIAVLTLFCFAPPAAQAQTYRLLTLPNIYTTVTAGVNTNNLYFDNASGYPVNTGLRLPKSLSGGLSFQTTFTCATVTLASVVFVIQGSADGTNFHNIPGSALVAHIPASAASANNTNVVYATNFPASAIQQFQWIRLAGITNGNAADATAITAQVGYWE